VNAFTAAQTAQLLKPINKNRVLSDGKGHSHVSQQDVLAHLIRVFGFGSFDIDVLKVECVFEQERVDPKTGESKGRWDVCYRALVRLTIRDVAGNEVCHYEDGSTATAQNQTRGDGHDLAYKSAISLSKKRAAIHLGDQFGLSLYNKGQLNALVKGTIVMPDGEQADGTDVQDGVPQQVSLGNDEVERDMEGPRESPTAMTPQQQMEHQQLTRDVQYDPRRAERLSRRDENDAWTGPAPQGEQAQRDLGL
jgi:recombination DNA repair RAD52 pathway protein